jgi:hypothetical protein
VPEGCYEKRRASATERYVLAYAAVSPLKKDATFRTEAYCVLRVSNGSIEFRQENLTGFYSLSSPTENLSLVAIGDENAFCQLYTRYYGRVKSFSQRFVHSEDMAENYAQDVFRKIWENRVMLDSDRSFSSYLYVMALNYLHRVSLLEKAYVRFIHDYALSCESADVDA